MQFIGQICTCVNPDIRQQVKLSRFEIVAQRGVYILAVFYPNDVFKGCDRLLHIYTYSSYTDHTALLTSEINVVPGLVIHMSYFSPDSM